jgi:nucleotide-binding universal stress UspA family protein
MFQHILVLLDGSGRAELALPVAARLARATGASLTLVRMMTLPADFTWSKLEPPFCDREILTAEMLYASTYLKGKAWELEVAGIAVQTHLLPGLAFPQLQALIEEEGIDLIVMCSRGRISFRPRIQSSMAWRVLQQSHVPVLVLQETFGQEGTLSYHGARPTRIMVPLDGSELAETILVPAAYLAAALSAPEPGTLHLVNVLPCADWPRTGERINTLRARAWRGRLAYLQATGQALLAGEMRHAKLSITTTVLTHPDIAERLVRAAELEQRGGEDACNILALTTHGRGGLCHPRIGGTTERILQEAHLPFLVVHPPLDKRPASQVGSAPPVRASTP